MSIIRWCYIEETQNLVGCVGRAIPQNLQNARKVDHYSQPVENVTIYIGDISSCYHNNFASDFQTNINDRLREGQHQLPAKGSNRKKIYVYYDPNVFTCDRGLLSTSDGKTINFRSQGLIPTVSYGQNSICFKLDYENDIGTFVNIASHAITPTAPHTIIIQDSGVSIANATVITSSTNLCKNEELC